MSLAGGQDEIARLVAAELDTPAPAEAQALVGDILRRHGDSVAAILFYGSCRRTGDMSGLLDLYVLHDGHRAFHGCGVHAFLNWLLPPNVLLLTPELGRAGARAKVAVLSERQFGARVRIAALDTTVWTRFSQPASLLYARDAAARDRTRANVAQAARTAVFWALRLGAATDTSERSWTRLFEQTYRAEIRPERHGRADVVYRSNPVWFDRLRATVLAEGAMSGSGRLPLAWMLRRLWSRPLNLLRLVKAVFTFDDGVDYIVWKISRHAGIRLPVSDWQRRHPLLAAPCLLWRLRRMR